MTPSPNSQSQPLEPLTIDIDQWQRDIQTFRDMTNSALRKIVAELSKHCTDGYATNSLPPQNISYFDELPRNPTPTFAESELDTHNQQRGQESNGRLARLEQELTRRISSGDPLNQITRES